MADIKVLIDGVKITKVVNEYNPNLAPSEKTVVSQSIIPQMYDMVRDGLAIGEDDASVQELLSASNAELDAAEVTMKFTGDNIDLHNDYADIITTVEEMEIVNAQALAAVTAAEAAATAAQAELYAVPKVHERTYRLGGSDKCFYPIWFVSHPTELHTLIVSNAELLCEIDIIGGGDENLNVRAMHITSITQDPENKLLLLPGVSMYSRKGNSAYGYSCSNRHGIYLRGGRSYTVQSYYKTMIDELAAPFVIGTVDSSVEQDTSAIEETFHLVFDSIRYTMKKLTETEVDAIPIDLRVSGATV